MAVARDSGYQQAHVAKINNINSIPDIFLFDRSGRARYKGLRGEQLLQKIEELLNEKPVKSTGVRSPEKTLKTIKLAS